MQEYSIKYYLDKPATLTGVACDRNGVIQVLSTDGLLHPANGQFLQPGSLQPDHTYRPMKDMALRAIGSQNQQLVYLSQQAVLSNAWAGKLFADHQLPKATLFAGTPALAFLVSDGSALHVVQDGKLVWKGTLPADEVVAVHYQPSANQFWILGKQTLSTLSGTNFTLTKVFEGAGFTAFALTKNNRKVIIGTTDGYLELDALSKKPIGGSASKTPLDGDNHGGRCKW